MKTRLDSRSAFPEDMGNYLEFNGWHFNKKMCQWAVSKMYKKDGEKKMNLLLIEDGIMMKINILFHL